MNNPENFSLKKDILIINDNSNDLYKLTIFLLKQGYQVRSERSGKQAIETAETTLPDLILLESRMPEMDGYQICQQLKASFRTKDIPVIFVSTSNAIVDRVRAFEVGGVDCITQPFQVEEVLARIENQLRLSRLCKQILEQNALLTKELEDCKRVEAELRENKHLLSAIIDTHPNVVYVYDLIEQRSFYHNRELYTSIGYTSEEVREMGAAILPNLMHPDDLAAFPGYIKQFETATEGEVFEFEYRMKHKNGEYRWFYSQDTLFARDKEGNPKQILGAATDITERKRMEEALRLSEERWQLAVCGNNDGIYDWNINTGEAFLSTQLTQMLGYENHELRHHVDTWRNLLHPDDVDRVMDILQAYLDRKLEQYVVEYRLRCKNGSYKWILARGQAQWDSDGKPIRMVGSHKDISERKLAEQKLRETTFLYQQILDAIPDFILCKASQSRIIYANKAFRDYYGMTMEQLQGIIDSPIVNPDYTQQYVKDDAYVFNTGQTLSIEEPVVRYDGIERLFSTVKTAIRDATGQVIQTVGVSRDITEQKLAEVALRQSEAQYRAKVQELEKAYRELQNTQAQLIQAEKMSSLGQMLAGIAHEINNPTSFIYGNITPAIEYAEDLLKIVELYRQYYPEPVAEISEQLEVKELDFIAEDFPKLLVSIKEGANRISQIVLSLRNFSRLDEKERQRVDIHEGIDNTLLLLKHRLKQQPSRPEIQVIKEYGELPLVEGYPSQLNQVFMNILSNAIDALEDSNGSRVMENKEESSHDRLPIIRIHTEVNESNSLTVRIADNGHGMTHEVQPNVFNPFFTTKPLGKGTGLGLAISYQIVVEKHSGRLECFSIQGQGTEFLISLPIESSQSKNEREE